MSEDRGTFRCYVPRSFTPEVEKVIAVANAIIDEYEGQGLSLTLRQLFYQFVSRDLMPNTQRDYTRLGDIVSNGRMAGLISWTALEDRGRGLRGFETFVSPGQALANAARDYKIDAWQNQPFRAEVWVEKQAMEGVLASICGELRVDFFATKGYNSQSEQWRAGMRFANYIQKGQRPIVFHLADHDPSGFDMTKDLSKRLALFVGMPVMVQRIALNSEQVHKYTPPPNPAKKTDSRIEKYIEEHNTDQSWELDALDPTVIRGIIKDAVLAVRDDKAWDETMEVEAADRRVLAEEAASMGWSGDEDEA